MGIVTSEEYKRFASIEGVKYNDRIEWLIEACSAVVEDVLGYKYHEQGFNETIYTTAGRQSYFLSRTDAIVSNVTYTRRATKETFKIDPDDIIIEDTGMFTLLAVDAGNHDKIVLELGYNTESGDTIKLATMLLVKYYFKEEFNKSGVSAGGQNVSYISGKNLPPHVRTLLQLHRII